MHISSFMVKSALLNSDPLVKESFIKDIKNSIENIIKKENLSIELKNTKSFEKSGLYEFNVPFRTNKTKSTYLIILQALRITALLHDLGHLPFSHQSEYALENIFEEIEKKENLTKKEKAFFDFYIQMTQNKTLVLHEAIGYKLIKILFEHELKIDNDDHLKLLYILIKNIIGEKKDKHFNYKVLHSFIDSTIDADRLDYINRDMLASGYISGAIDFIRITKQSVLVQKDKKYILSFFDDETIDIEHMLEMRFNLYKKIIFNHKISATDTHLENVILFMAKRYFSEKKDEDINDSISMLWRFLEDKDLDISLDTISLLDENWLISLFKKEYFKIKRKEEKTIEEQKYLCSFEEVLFGKRFYKSIWKNLNDLYHVLDFEEIQRYKFRESFGYVNKNKDTQLKQKLNDFCKKYEKKDRYFTFQIVSLNIGIDKDFSLYDGEKLIKIDEVSTIRKRLKKSILNTVPFYLYSNETYLDDDMKSVLKNILIDTFL